MSAASWFPSKDPSISLYHLQEDHHEIKFYLHVCRFLILYQPQSGLSQIPLLMYFLIDAVAIK